ncbi:MAG TPA: DUF983 domain-containing protein [Actinomycetota bacterium]|nr:DUF983 domain-containing protein [Actinomycetota bacterium]
MPSIPVLFLRALARRCPRCGQGRLFRRWFTLPETCPRCGLRFEREEGAFLGSLALNYGVTAVLFIGTLVVWLILTLPDVAVVPLTITCIAIAAIFPLIFFPFAKMLWTATDLWLHGPERDDSGSGL